MKTDPKKIDDYLERLYSRYTRCCHNYSIWQSLESAKLKTDSLKVINQHKDFFIPIIDSIRLGFILELSKFFDYSKKSLSIKKVISLMNNNLKELSNEFKDLEGKHKTILKKIKLVRDKYLAHDDIVKIEPILSGMAIIDLFKDLEKILNGLSSKTSSTTIAFDYPAEKSKSDTDHLLSRLIGSNKKAIDQNALLVPGAGVEPARKLPLEGF